MKAASKTSEQIQLGRGCCMRTNFQSNIKYPIKRKYLKRILLSFFVKTNENDLVVEVFDLN